MRDAGKGIGHPRGTLSCSGHRGPILLGPLGIVPEGEEGLPPLMVRSAVVGSSAPCPPRFALCQRGSGLALPHVVASGKPTRVKPGQHVRGSGYTFTELVVMPRPERTCGQSMRWGPEGPRHLPNWQEGLSNGTTCFREPESLPMFIFLGRG